MGFVPEDSDTRINTGTCQLRGVMLQTPAACMVCGVWVTGTLETTRVKDANQVEPCQGVVRSVGFHPGNALLMTGSMDKRLRLFQVGQLTSAFDCISTNALVVAGHWDMGQVSSAHTARLSCCM